MCAHMYVWMIQKQSSLFLDDVEIIDVSLNLALFFSFFCRYGYGLYWPLQAGFFLFHTVFQKKFFSSVWYKQDEFRFTMVLEYWPAH